MAAGTSSTPCAACKQQRRRCTEGCVFAPYFPPDEPRKFASVHRVFGASNVARLLARLSPAQREDAASSLAYEAEARLRDPVHGCLSYIHLLHLRIRQAQADLSAARNELSSFIGPAAHAPFLPHLPSTAAAMPPQQAGIHMQEQQQQFSPTMEAARGQEMLLRSFHAATHDGRAATQMGSGGGGGPTVAAVAPQPPSGLGMVQPAATHESPYPQAQPQNQQPQVLLEQPLLAAQQQQHERAGSDNGRRGIGPSSSSRGSMEASLS